MQLLTTIPHLRGSKVTVGGSEYAVDAKGIARGVSDDHADILLQSREAWALYGAEPPAADKKKVDLTDDVGEANVEADPDDVLGQMGDLMGDLGPHSDGKKKKRRG